MLYKEDVIYKKFKDGIPAVIQKEVKENFGNDYWTIPTDEWIDMLETLESRDNRRGAARESQKPSTKKKND